ncbi:hypothetical protein [Fredinandcohnia quinoae]|nr:hypothetical protein [Fredinandcohnia sp. SECRCQ15]
MIATITKGAILKNQEDQQSIARYFLNFQQSAPKGRFSWIAKLA